ncbi:MAG: DinB family protein [Acidobacteria bacterium]|nr:DinB family protein [Acidobacteriota bacterium]
MQVQRWVERTFRFDFPVELFPTLLERVRGTPARIEEKIRPLSKETLRRRDGEKWSIQEHIGHLLDLDALHLGRLDDYLAGAATLRPADITNRATTEANYNQRDIAVVTADFRNARGHFVQRLEAWNPARLEQSALHPRLKQPMRLLDMVYFVAEHDDHHLAKMSELAKISLPR